MLSEEKLKEIGDSKELSTVIAALADLCPANIKDRLYVLFVAHNVKVRRDLLLELEKTPELAKYLLAQVEPKNWSTSQGCTDA